MIYASAANLTERELYTITEAFTVTKFMPGEIIVVQGDLGNKLYIVKKVHFPKMVSNSNRNHPLLSLFSLSSLSLSLSIPSPPLHYLVLFFMSLLEGLGCLRSTAR